MPTYYPLDPMPPLLPMVRSPGIHVSALINNLCIATGIYSEQTEWNYSRLEVGNCHERAFIQRCHEHDPDRFACLGELEYDGIYGTPDLFDLHEQRILEVKFTWLSSRHEVDSAKLWKYWVQVMAYCHMTQTTKGGVHIMHIRGDYRGTEPIEQPWGADFTKTELAENWAMLKSRIPYLENHD